MHDDDDHWERLIFGAEKFQRDLEVHALNLKFHHSESGHWQDKAHKILRWILLFAILTVSLMILTLLELFIGHQSNWWLVGGGYFCCLISCVLAYVHGRCIKRSRAASERFRSLEPPASLRPLMASIDAEIEADERAAAAAKKRGWRYGRRLSQYGERRQPGRLGHD
ncbi:hypothetical protein [Rhodococcus koreensis]|uniref:Uncharacterized protein n=1 Tax=Rhodococcus koreensis TaxID=99653 RepID=A0A1H4I7Z2_9NOCA|nr:hypothetical protein [Rhodococcus koreensis]SEB30025.1 hypothetical protein SAMN04490239_0180 [Rhodococcus koreensis]